MSHALMFQLSDSSRERDVPYAPEMLFDFADSQKICQKINGVNRQRRAF